MPGDIQERFVRGKSRLWFWQEVGVAIAVSTYSATQFNRSSIMKRAIFTTIVLLGVFALGYWTARSPLVIHGEMPGPEQMAELRDMRAHQVRARSLRLQRDGTQEFLEQVLAKAQENYKRTGTPESKAEVERLKARLDEAQSSWKTRGDVYARRRRPEAGPVSQPPSGR